MKDPKFCNMCEGKTGLRIEMDEFPRDQLRKDFYRCPRCKHIIKIQETLKI